MSDTVSLRPIGYVESEYRDGQLDLSQTISEVVLGEDYVEGLDGVEGYSHLFILYWMHGVPYDKTRVLKDYPIPRRDIPMKGCFATRSTQRPNPIGLSLVELISRKKNKLTVKGLDAINGSPVLDIKPFQELEFARRARLPDWWPVVEL